MARILEMLLEGELAFHAFNDADTPVSGKDQPTYPEMVAGLNEALWRVAGAPREARRYSHARPADSAR